MQTLVFVIEYDGANFSGWQIQPNARSVQEELEIALYNLYKERINVVGSGRTDAGVHAFGQVASAEIKNVLIPENKIIRALNAKLPDCIKIINAKYFPFKFHARFDAVEREYVYFLSNDVSVFKRNYVSIYPLPFDKQKLFEIAPIFTGIKDFTTLSKINKDIHNNICNVTVSEWEENGYGEMVYRIRANHFLYGMVRAVVGIMLDYARGKRTREEIQKAIEKKERNLASAFAPPQGLFLSRVFYNEEINQILYQ
jgi:tRNA pseudouridine38-40 synthase